MEPQNLAAQLRCPSGDDAAEVALKMNDANRAVNQRCIELLQIESKDRVLEIGPGNGVFVRDIIRQAQDVSYAGLDWSAEMVAEAERLNWALVASGHARFAQGSSDQLPFDAEAFDKVLAVHTIYFWAHPEQHLAEICRVVRPGGMFCMAFGDRAFMQELPFAPYGFTLYDDTQAGLLLQASGFDVIATHAHHETGLSNTGAVVEKVVHLVVSRVP